MNDKIFWSGEGLLYFLLHPRLWKGPLLIVITFVLFIVALFFTVVLWSWPGHDLTWIQYLLGVLKSLGYGLTAIVTLWVIILPLGLSSCFTGLAKAVFQENNIVVVEERFFKSIHSGVQVLLKTLGWRIFWPLFTLFCTVFFGPTGVLVGHIGLGHISAIDACDISLSVLGLPGDERMRIIKKHMGRVFLGGLVGGFLSFILSFTVIAWIFWLPGMFTGAALWIRGWPKSTTHLRKGT